MERTQRLLSIALAVLALDGCAASPGEQVERPRPSASPTASPHGRSSHSHHYGGFFGGHYGAAAGVAGAAAANRNRNATHDRTLGGKRSASKGSFGHAGSHGGG